MWPRSSSRCGSSRSLSPSRHTGRVATDRGDRQSRPRQYDEHHAVRPRRRKRPPEIGQAAIGGPEFRSKYLCNATGGSSAADMDRFGGPRFPIGMVREDLPVVGVADGLWERLVVAWAARIGVRAVVAFLAARISHLAATKSQRNSAALPAPADYHNRHHTPTPSVTLRTLPPKSTTGSAMSRAPRSEAAHPEP
jgi:hypothetical protein